LLKNGVPFDVAFSLSDGMKSAFCIAFGELDGFRFNFSSGEWEKSQ